MGYGILLQGFLGCLLTAILQCLPVKKISVTEVYSKGTETQVMDSSTTNALGRAFFLRVGSTYLGNVAAVPSSYVPVYNFFRTKLAGPFLQGSALDDAIIAMTRPLLLESKLFLSASSQSTQPYKRYVLSYDTVADKYTQISRTTTNTGLRGFNGLASHPNIDSYAFWLHTGKNLFIWTQTSGLGAFCTTVHSVALYMQPYNSTVLVYGSSHTMMQFVSVSTMTIANSLTGVYLAHYFKVDSTDPNSIYLMQNVAPFTLANIDISGLGAYSTKVTRVFTSASKSHLMLFGVFPFVAMANGDNTLIMMHKTTLLTVDVDIFPEQLPFVGFIGNTLDQTVATTFKFPIHYLVRGSGCVNMHMFYFYFDFCNRGPAGDCLSCPAGYYKLPTSDACFPISNGVSNNQVSACSVPNCKECLASSDTCTMCSSTPSKLYLLNNLCVPSIVAGYGPSENSLVKCQDSHCLDCSSAFDKCLECDTQGGWYSVGGICTSATDIQSSKMGVDTISGTLKPCSIPQCLSCVADYNRCTVCDSSNGFVLAPNGRACTDQFLGTQRSRILLTYDSREQTVLMEFPGPIDTNVADSHFMIQLRDAADFRSGVNCSADSEVKVRITQVEPTHILFSIKAQKQIIDGNLTFQANPYLQMKTAAGTDLLGFPVSQAGIRKASLRESTLITVAAATGEVLSWAKLPLTILGAIAQSRSPGSPNYIFSQQSVLALLEGPWVELPDQILYNSIQYIQGVPPLPNLFAMLGSDSEVCQLPARYEKLEMECSYLLNFGAPLLSIFIFLTLSITVEQIYRRLKTSILRAKSLVVNQATINPAVDQSKILAKGITESSASLTASSRYFSRKSNYLVWWTKNLQGLRLHFTIQYVEAIMAEMLLYSLLNLIQKPSLLTMQLGGFFSVLAFVYHIAIFFMCLKCAIKLMGESSTVAQNSLQPLSKVVDLEHTSYPALVKRYEECCTPFTIFRVLQPLADYLRSFLFAFVVTGLQPYPAVQIGMTIGIQTLFILNYWMFYSLKSPSEKRITLWIELQFLAYMVLKMLVVYDQDIERTQNATGMAMAIILISLQITSVLVECSNLIQIAYEMIRSRAQKSLKHFNSSPSIVLESERAKMVKSVTELVGSQILADFPQANEAKKVKLARKLVQSEVPNPPDLVEEDFLVEELASGDISNSRIKERKEAVKPEGVYLRPQAHEEHTLITPVTTEDPQLREEKQIGKVLTDPELAPDGKDVCTSQQLEPHLVTSSLPSKDQL